MTKLFIHGTCPSKPHIKRIIEKLDVDRDMVYISDGSAVARTVLECAGNGLLVMCCGLNRDSENDDFIGGRIHYFNMASEISETYSMKVPKSKKWEKNNFIVRENMEDEIHIEDYLISICQKIIHFGSDVNFKRKIDEMNIGMNDYPKKLLMLEIEMA
jgi:hypothetical protein